MGQFHPKPEDFWLFFRIQNREKTTKTAKKNNHINTI